MTVDLFLLT